MQIHYDITAVKAVLVPATVSGYGDDNYTIYHFVNFII